MTDKKTNDQSARLGLETPKKSGNAASMVLILCSLAALVLSQVIRTTLAPELRLVPLLILPIGLVLFFIGILAMDKGHLPGWFERFLNTGSHWLGINPAQFLSLKFSFIVVS